MWSITITLGQLLIAILIFFILRSVWYKIDKNKWNQGICKKCNKGNYRYVMMTLTNWNDILNIFNMT